MKVKHTDKPYWEMTAQELAKATAEFDVEFVANQAKRLSSTLRSRWERAKAKRSVATNSTLDQVIAVRLEKKLLKRCTDLAKRKRVPRDFLISCSLQALLAAEGKENGTS
jgi:hypothetical protein